MRFENLRGLLSSHPGAVKQPVRLMQRGDRLGGHVLPLEADHVDAADLRGVAFHEHERRHVVHDARQAADIAMSTHRYELVQPHSTRDRGERLDVDVPGEHRVIRHQNAVAEHAVVPDMGAGHQEVIRADARDALFLGAGSVDRHGLANHVAVADLDPRWLSFVRVVLRIAADDREGMDDVLFAQAGVPQDANVGDQPGAAADTHVGADHAVGPDLHVVGDVGAGVNACRVGNHRGHENDP